MTNVHYKILSITYTWYIIYALFTMHISLCFNRCCRNSSGIQLLCIKFPLSNFSCIRIVTKEIYTFLYGTIAHKQVHNIDQLIIICIKSLN